MATTVQQFNALYAELERQIAPAKLATNPQDAYFNGALIADYIKKNFDGHLTVDNMHKAVKALRMLGLRWDIEPKINLRDKGLLKEEVDESNIIHLESGKNKAQMAKEAEEKARSEYRNAAATFIVHRAGRCDHAYTEDCRQSLRDTYTQLEGMGMPAEDILEVIVGQVHKLQTAYENQISRSGGRQ